MDKLDLQLAAIKKDKDNATEAVKPMRPRRFNRRAGDKRQNISSTWLVSFTDVMALMLTFFVLLFSMSDPNKAEWEKLKDEYQENFSQNRGQPLNRGAQDTINIDKVNFSQALSLFYLKRLFITQIENSTVLASVEMMEIDGGLILSLPQQLLFEAGQASVKEAGVEALFELAGVLNRVKNRIEVVGHTDPRPVTGGRFPSNWELSLARAANVAAVLENVGYNDAITVRGHASARFDELDTTLPIEQRLDLSRRVDVVIMEDDGKRLQLFNISPIK